MKTTAHITIDNKELPLNGERNLLEVIRKAKIELPTFCYHSELSVYGACRLCMVDIEGKGLVPSCSTIAEAGMKVRTNTEEIRSMRRIIVELLLASHEQACPTCAKSSTCQLQNLARRLGVKKVRFKSQAPARAVDCSSRSLVRDPNKCVLCGDCVRMCEEVQGVGAIDFAHRGSQSMVVPSFGKNLDKVECVNCGQCARVCPTGALTPRSEVEEVWKALDDPGKTVVVQIAPAVRVAIGELFGLAPGVSATGQIVAALRAMGFDKVFDTSFTADLTVIEEGNEFIGRIKERAPLPLLTSCCPAWVKFVEQYYPDFLPHVSTCRSPQQMFGSLAKELLPEALKVKREDLVVVSLMPCTAKKFEAKREEFSRDGLYDVDHVITTQELARMIEEAGLRFEELEPESFDLPFGFKTGAGVIFGNTGGVSEAVLRYVSEKLAADTRDTYEFAMVRGEQGIRQATLAVNGREYTLGIAHGLANAKKVLEGVRKGIYAFDLIEVMACPGGCIGGAGQPVYKDPGVRQKRTRGLYENDKMLQLHKAQENPYVQELYKNVFKGHAGHRVHELLHTGYKSRRRVVKKALTLAQPQVKKMEVEVCFGTGCFLKGAQKLFRSLIAHIAEKGWKDAVEVKASFCFEKCDRGPVVRINSQVLEKCTLEKATAVLTQEMGNG